MPEPGLHHLKRQFEAAVGAAIDTPRGVEVAQRVQAGILGSALAIDHASGELRRLQTVLDDAVAVLDAAEAVREHEVQTVARARETMRAQHVHKLGRQRDGALARLRLRTPDLAVAVSALAHVKLNALEVDVLPPQPAKLRGAQAGEDRGQEQRPPARGVGDDGEGVDDGAYLGGRRDVDADLELAVALAAALTTVLAQRVDDVLSDEAALLGVGEKSAERAASLAHHRWRASLLAQPVLEATDQRGR